MISTDLILHKLRNNKSIFAKYGISALGLFGSYARNEQNENSDIDILIDFFPGYETFDNFMTVYDSLEKLFENEKVEVVTKKGLSPYLSKYIFQEIQYV